MKRGYEQVHITSVPRWMSMLLIMYSDVQRSVVILTHHPYPALFMSVLSKLGPLHQLHGDAILEVACHNILSW